MLLFIVIGIVANIVIQIVFRILLSISIAIREQYVNGESDDKLIEKEIAAEMVEDEMDKLVELKSLRVGFVIAGIGPKSGIFGADIAGLVEAVGQDTMKFKVGDAVFGELSINDFGGLAEYVAAPETLLAKKLDSVSFEHAAAIPMASITALQGLREKGRIRPVIDRRYSLAESGEAFDYLKSGHVGGKVVVNVIS
jgi:D-arabinose 1-dehydrogenase-like Zn-dependent alcohol dehydrogenase